MQVKGWPILMSFKCWTESFELSLCASGITKPEKHLVKMSQSDILLKAEDITKAEHRELFQH